MTVVVSRADDELKVRALQVLFHELLDHEFDEQLRTVLTAEQNGEINLQGLFLAVEEGHDVGACLTLFQADKSAFLWPPVIPNAEKWSQVGSAMLMKIGEEFDSKEMIYTQSMLELEERDQRSLLEKNGYPFLAELIFMECDLTKTSIAPLNAVEARGVSEAKQDSPTWRLTPLSDLPDSQDFQYVLERTYESTLDVPEFNLLRTGKDSLESHQVNGPFQPELWWLFYEGQKPAGLVLLRNYEADKRWEVAYMGVVPEIRGRGLGRHILAETLSAAQKADRQAVFLAVDARNHYAIETYKSIGFYAINSKVVHVRHKS